MITKDSVKIGLVFAVEHELSWEAHANALQLSEQVAAPDMVVSRQDQRHKLGGTRSLLFIQFMASTQKKSDRWLSSGLMSVEKSAQR